MDQKKPNHSIRCRVSSCSYNCGDTQYCSLQSIQVDPCPDCGNGHADDESMCASYKHQ